MAKLEIYYYKNEMAHNYNEFVTFLPLLRIRFYVIHIINPWHGYDSKILKQNNKIHSSICSFCLNLIKLCEIWYHLLICSLFCFSFWWHRNITFQALKFTKIKSPSNIKCDRFFCFKNNLLIKITNFFV